MGELKEMDEMTLKEAYDCIYNEKKCDECRFCEERLQVCYLKAKEVIAAAVEELIEKEGE